jgi:hypothetical protein
MRQHKRFGVFFQACDHPKLQNCLVTGNMYGVMLAGNKGALVEQCEIGPNTVDGFRDTFGGRGTVVRRCYIHHHFDSSAHPDNVQLHDGVKDILFDSNLLICGGQSMMMSNVEGLTLRNNLILGSAANMVICAGTVKDCTFERNTFALFASSLFAMAGGTFYKLSGNILVDQGGSIFYAAPDGVTFESDRNLFWIEPGYTAMAPWRGKGGSYATLEALQKATPWEAHSEFKDPQFASAPYYVTVSQYRRLSESTPGRIVVSRAQVFKVGDHVETNFDGVVRTVKAIDGDAVTIDPPMDHLTVFTLISNWKDRTDYKYDYKTPLGETYGSTISVPQYVQGDFNGDGKRDVPAVPER